MSGGPTTIPIQCLSLKESLTLTNMKSVLRGFIYEYETPKIVTIHSISIALTCRLIQLLILTYGIAYLMIIKKGYQELDTSIISSVTLKVKGIGYNQTGENQTLVIDGADYIVPPQENNALFLMSNFIRTDQTLGFCSEPERERAATCYNDSGCQNKDYQKANGKWTGRCLINKSSTTNKSLPTSGLCELEGWCPVENDIDVPEPILDALNFTIFIKNFIEFPRFNVIRKNIGSNPSYLKQCNYDDKENKICPIFRVGTLLSIVEKDNEAERIQMLKYGGVIRVKIDWLCNLDKPLEHCLPKYSFGRLDAKLSEESFSYGFNFRFASHWNHGNGSFRTLTKAFGLRFIISVSGQAGRFDLITLSLNIGSLIGILGLATFICDIVALYVHRQSGVYRQQKFQDVDLNLLQLETLNSLAEGMMSEVAKRKHQAHLEQALLTGQVIGNSDAIDKVDTILKVNVQRSKENHHQPGHLYDNISTSPVWINQVSSPSENYHQQEQIGTTNKLGETSSSSSSIKQRRSTTTTSATRTIHLTDSCDTAHDIDDKTHALFTDQQSQDITGTDRPNEITRNLTIKNTPPMPNGHEHLSRPSPKIETFL